MILGYFGIHNHTEYSNLRLLDSTNKLTKLIDKAIELGLSGIAITDHESLSGHIKAIQYQKKLNDKDIDFKIALGNEIYLVNSLEDVKDNYQSGVTKFFHFILIAKDEVGHKQLRKISSSAWSHSFYTGKMERVPTIKSELEEIIGEDKGHLIASTACIGGELAYWILNKRTDKLLDFLTWCQDVFLPENFYLEMQPNDCDEQMFVNKIILKISEQLGIPFVISTDCHYLTKDHAKIHEAYLNSREDESRETGEFYKTCYLMDEEEIHQWMDGQIGKDNVNVGLSNTNRILDEIKFFDLACPTIVPDVEIPFFVISHFFMRYYEDHPYIKKFAYSDDVHDRYLLKLIEDGYREKIPYPDLSKEQELELIDRIEIELSEMWKVTEKLGTSISAYYITTLDLVNLMWNEGDSFVGVARGSVTGMFTMYLIGITQLNPLPYNLKHWRHISHTKIELSDVDLDSAANRRGKIIEAVKTKRGYNKALNCCTFKTEGPKAAVLTAARGLGIPNEESQYIASLIPVTRGFTWSINDCVNGNEAEDRKPVTELVTECNKYPGLLDTALAIEGMVCGRSIHASAVYLFNSDYNDHNAMMKAPNGIDITQWNMKDSDYDGGLKEDLLTVVTEDKLRLCMDLLVDAGHMEWQGSLRATYNKYLHPDVLDYESPKMWDMLGRGEITDIFQFESDLGKQAIKKIKPRTLVELATASSIMRLMKPSGEQPMDTYVRYKNDINEWYKSMREDYHLTEHEIQIMEKYLLEFHGIGATQEDVMLVSMDSEVSGFDVKTANLLRKGISKKDKDLQKKMKDLLFEKGRALGTSENLLNYVWEEIIGKQLGLTR
jgi:DNA polymerase-3 subunit alpha